MGRGGRQDQLMYLFRKQSGLCFICHLPAILDGCGGDSRSERSAVRFRLGSSFGAKGRVRYRVMTCRKCAQERSDQIQMSQPIDDTRRRSGRFPTEFYSIVDAGGAPSEQAGSEDVRINGIPACRPGAINQ